MITLQITTSTRTMTYMLDIPIDDRVELHYDGRCKYCSTDIRTDAIRREAREFCSQKSHNVMYSQKRIADAELASSR